MRFFLLLLLSTTALAQTPPPAGPKSKDRQLPGFSKAGSERQLELENELFKRLDTAALQYFFVQGIRHNDSLIPSLNNGIFQLGIERNRLIRWQGPGCRCPDKK